MDVQVISVSTKGQIVLPAPMRRSLSIGAGDHLAVYATDDVIVLKKLDLPTDVEFDAWLDKVRLNLEGQEADV